MATKALTLWWEEVAPDVAGVNMPAVVSAVRNACIKFCAETFLWTADLTRINVEANTQSYTLTAPSDSVIIGVDDVKYKQNGADDDQFVTLDPISETQKNLHDTGSWKYRTSPTPSGYFVDKDKNLLLYRIPTVASTSGLLVKVNLKPDRACTTVDEFLYNDHFETIGHGAKADLFLRRAMPWFDGNLALVHRALFTNAINNAKPLKTTGYTKRPMRVRMRDFV